MKCQTLFSEKNIVSLLCAEFAKGVVKVNPCPAEPRYAFANSIDPNLLQKPTDLDLHCFTSSM